MCFILCIGGFILRTQRWIFVDVLLNGVGCWKSREQVIRTSQILIEHFDRPISILPFQLKLLTTVLYVTPQRPLSTASSEYFESVPYRLSCSKAGAMCCIHELAAVVVLQCCSLNSCCVVGQHRPALSQGHIHSTHLTVIVIGQQLFHSSFPLDSMIIESPVVSRKHFVSSARRWNLKDYLFLTEV